MLIGNPNKCLGFFIHLRIKNKKMKTFSVFLLFSLISFLTFSQEEDTEPATIEGQFDKIFRTSTSYQTYKVISRDMYLDLKENVLDSIKKSKKALSEKENLLKSELKNIIQLNDTLSKIKIELENALQNENSISLFGAPLNKTSYNLILWTIIIGLTFGLGFFIFKFLNSNVLTKEAQESLLIVEQEFDAHRKKSIEREQKLRRQLQDEINKHRNA